MKLKNLLKGAVRAAGALVGSSLGGPAGAAIGAGLATKLTGGSNQDALLGGVVSGLGAYALPKVGGKLGLSSDSLFGAGVPAGAGGDMGYINSGGPSAAGRALNFATSPAGLGALAAGTLALGPSEAPPATAPATSPARDNRTLEEMGYDTSPLQRERIQYEDAPYSYGETGGERRYFRHGGSIARYADGGSVDAPDFSGYDTSSIDASGGVAGGLAGTGFSFDADSGVSTPPAAVDFSPPPGMSLPGVSTPPTVPQSTSIFQRGVDALTGRVNDMVQNPGRTAVNVVAAGIPVVGQINTLSSLLGGPTLGSMAMQAAQGLGGYGKGSGVPGDADGDGVVTTGDDYANYDNSAPQGPPDSISYQDSIPGKVDDGVAAPSTGISLLQPVLQDSAALDGGRRRSLPAPDWARYGEIGPEARFFMARGGLARGMDFAGMARAAYERGGKVAGPGDGQSDDIPAMLSDGEYVWSAADVAALGQGSNEAGAKKLDKMRKTVRKQAGYKNAGRIQKQTKSIASLMKSVG